MAIGRTNVSGTSGRYIAKITGIVKAGEDIENYRYIRKARATGLVGGIKGISHIDEEGTVYFIYYSHVEGVNPITKVKKTIPQRMDGYDLVEKSKRFHSNSMNDFIYYIDEYGNKLYTQIFKKQFILESSGYYICNEIEINPKPRINKLNFRGLKIRKKDDYVGKVFMINKETFNIDFMGEIRKDIYDEKGLELVSVENRSFKGYMPAYYSQTSGIADDTSNNLFYDYKDKIYRDCYGNIYDFTYAFIPKEQENEVEIEKTKNIRCMFEKLPRVIKK